MAQFNEESILPTNYGDTKITLLPRDPVWMFTYWEISQNTKEHFAKTYGDNLIPSFLILRVYDVTNIVFDGNNDNRHFDIRISQKADNWYINVGEFNRVWLVEVGYILKDGTFVAISRSNAVRLPRYGISEMEVEDERWASYHVLERNFEEHIGNSSANMVKFSNQRDEWNSNFGLFRLPSSMPSSMPSSRSSSRFFAPEVKKEKFFWLKADTEILLYGATDPSANLVICGKEVPINEDGSFSLRFYLPEGKHEYLVEAVSSDKTMSKRILFTVNKQTK
jgi:hypothetical protein